ncbi:MAG: DUF2961 domain-containing protein [Phycisphaerales bacterium]|jgi:hypothetical protein
MRKLVLFTVSGIVLTLFALSTARADGTKLLKSDSTLDGAVNGFDLAILANEWLTSGQPYAPVTKPFPGPAELRCNQTQRNTVLAGQWETIFNLDDGPCLVTNFWVAADFAGKRRRTPIRIYFDDHNSPDIEGWTGDLFACGPDEPANFRGDFIGVTNSQESGEGSGYPGFSGYLRLPMPYYESIQVDIQNPTASNKLCWMMLERLPIDPNRLYCIGLKPGMYLKTYGFGQDGNKEHYNELVLLDTSEPTILAGVFQYIDNSTAAGGGNNFKYLEGDHRIYYGTSGTPSYRSSGAEDFYHSSWYFQEGLFDHMDECLVLKNTTDYRIAASRFFPLERAPYHEDGIKFTWQVGESAMPDPCEPYVRWITWYYQ